MKLKYLILFSLLLCWAFDSSAQHRKKKDDDKIGRIQQDTVKSKPITLTTDEFRNFHLPPLETFFENARNNPRIKAIEASIEAARMDLKTSRRDWFKYFSLRAGYTYGILGTYSDLESEYVPLHTTYSGATQNSWNVGANISIPLDHLINHNLQTRKQKQVYQNAQYTQEIIFNEIKSEIIELYCDLQYQLKLLKMATESLTLYTSEYAISETEFINNDSKNRSLSDLKHSHQVALTEYETILNRINILFLKLELISNTKLINK